MLMAAAPPGTVVAPPGPVSSTLGSPDIFAAAALLLVRRRLVWRRVLELRFAARPWRSSAMSWSGGSCGSAGVVSWSSVSDVESAFGGPTVPEEILDDAPDPAPRPAPDDLPLVPDFDGASGSLYVLVRPLLAAWLLALCMIRLMACAWPVAALFQGTDGAVADGREPLVFPGNWRLLARTAPRVISLISAHLSGCTGPL